MTQKHESLNRYSLSLVRMTPSINEFSSSQSVVKSVQLLFVGKELSPKHPKKQMARKRRDIRQEEEEPMVLRY
jgi:hypothetical protein